MKSLCGAWFGVSALAAIDALTFSPANGATFKGLFIVINPFDTTTPICGNSGDGLLWLTSSSCSAPNGNASNKVKSLLQSGAINGVFLHINWNDWYTDYHDNSGKGLAAAFTAIVDIAKAGNQKFNITLGMAAGTNVPCEVYAQTPSLGPILLPNLGGNNKVACNALPRLWAGPGLPNYANDIVTLFTTSQNLISGYGAITGLKLSGIDTKTLEMYIVGSPKSFDPSAANYCSTMNKSCNTNAASALLNDGYNPPAIESTWNSFAQREASLLSGSPNLMFEADVTGENAFPPITASQTPTGQQPNFSCASGNCVIDAAANVGKFNLSAFAGDGYYFSQQLLTDLATDGIPTSSLAVQTDGLQSQGGNVNPDPNQEPLPLPCWAYRNLGTTPNRTQMGFQSVGPQLIPFTIMDYENGLGAGISYGALYEELWPYEVQYYTSLSGNNSPTLFVNTTKSLTSNTPGTRVCAGLPSTQ